VPQSNALVLEFVGLCTVEKDGERQKVEVNCHWVLAPHPMHAFKFYFRNRKLELSMLVPKQLSKRF
jgi:hypothetical protein